jgi:hypothetical protein
VFGHYERMNRWTTVVVVALPGLTLAGFGLFHPVGLDTNTAAMWWRFHIPLIPVFPLLAAAVWVLLRGETGPVAWVARVAAYLYACLYTALDTISGISAGIVTQYGGSQAMLDLFAVGDGLGHIGVWFLAGATVLAGALLVRRDGLLVVPGTVIALVAAYAFYRFHIFPPYGALAMLGYAVGFGLMAAARRPVPAAEPVPVP